MVYCLFYAGVIVVLKGGVNLDKGLHHFSGSTGSFPRIVFHSHTMPSTILTKILQPFFIAK